MLLAERFVPGTGWVEAVILSVYATLVCRAMLDPARQPRWRRFTWRLFSAVFYSQLLLGLIGIEKCLMTGKLHLPVPAVIAAGPAWRGEGFFMLGLFLSTVLLVGPAWCSHLCYLGAWDDLAATRRQHGAKPLPRWTRAGKAVFALAVILAAFLMGFAGVPGQLAALAGGVFGVLGVAVMAWFSTRSGAMTHCLFWCPIGVLATRFGRISPFRLVIDRSCTRCKACFRTCRYDALGEEDLERGRPAISCTLCGDCLASCRFVSIRYRFAALSGDHARMLFIVLVSALHSVFLGLARI
jgi:polyferredoxin